jgi:sulfite oxidase
MLAYEMNGEDIPAEHGYPIRMVSPGFIAVRSAKWVNKLIISDVEADSAP